VSKSPNIDGNDHAGQIFNFVESIGANAQIIFQAGFANQGYLTVWLDGARPHPKYVFESDISSTNPKI
jgi:hypothetical protein